MFDKMFDKIKLLANTFLTFGVVFGLITLVDIFRLDLIEIVKHDFAVSFGWHWIAFLILVFLTILFIVLGISLKCIYKQLYDEIQSIYHYYDKKIEDIEEDK